MGKVSLEAKVHEETRILLEEIRKEDGRPFDVRNHLPKAVSNIICSIIYGSRFEYNDPVFEANIKVNIKDQKKPWTTLHHKYLKPL